MVTKTNKIHTFQINVLIQFLVSSTCFEHCGFTIRKTIVSILISITSFHLLDCLHKQNITIQHVQMVFLMMMNPQCSKHVEGTKNWIKTLIGKVCISLVFFLWRCDPTRVMASSFRRSLDHTQRRTTVGRTPLEEWSARRRDLYLTIHNRQISMPSVGFEPTISAGERPQTYALDRARPLGPALSWLTLHNCMILYGARNMFCNRTHPYPVTLLPTGSGYFWANPFSLWIPQHFLNVIILHLSTYEDGTDRVFRNVGI